MTALDFCPYVGRVQVTVGHGLTKTFALVLAHSICNFVSPTVFAVINMHGTYRSESPMD
jgi:hypothetical protein